MMWETYRTGSPKDRLFDFKCLRGRTVHRLNRPAVFFRDDLTGLFELYTERTGTLGFPTRNQSSSDA